MKQSKARSRRLFHYVEFLLACPKQFKMGQGSMISCSLTAKLSHILGFSKNLKSHFPNKTHFPVYQEHGKGVVRAKQFQLESVFWLDFQSKHELISKSILYINDSSRSISGLFQIGNLIGIQFGTILEHYSLSISVYLY